MTDPLLAFEFAMSFLNSSLGLPDNSSVLRAHYSDGYRDSSVSGSIQANSRQYSFAERRST